MLTPNVVVTTVDRSRYGCIRSLDRLRTVVRWAHARDVIGFDTETTGLNVFRVDLVGFCLAIAPGVAFYVPLRHRGPDGELLAGQIDFHAAMLALAPLLADPTVVKVMHGARYDIQIMLGVGVEIVNFADTRLMAAVDDGGSELTNMDMLAKRHLSHTTVTYDDVTGRGRKKVTFDYVPLDAATEYAAEDPDVTLRLFYVLQARLQASGLLRVYLELELPLVMPLVWIERRGMLADMEYLHKLSAEFSVRMNQLLAEARELAGEPALDLGSPANLGDLLFDRLGMPVIEMTETGKRSTKAAVLTQLAEAGHTLPVKILEWRALKKLDSTYARALPTFVNSNTGKIHTTFNQARVRTSRLSCLQPNLQQIPRKIEEGRRIRRAFIAASGYKLISADYNQIELRMLAEIGNVEALKREFREGRDIHAATVAGIFNIPISEVTKDQRGVGKTVNFAVVYGAGAERLAQQLGLTLVEAEAFLRSYFKRFPGVAAFRERSKAMCRSKRYVTTLFGRRLLYPEIKTYDPQIRSRTERQCVNARLQGSAADIIRRAMIGMDEALAAAGLSVQCILQVHDELLFECPEHEVDAATGVIRSVMEGACLPDIQLSIPLSVDINPGDNWAEAH